MKNYIDEYSIRKTYLVDEIICDIEFVIKGLPGNTEDIIIQDCSASLRKDKPPKRNISKLEFDALKSLNNNKDIVTPKAHKGGALVLLDK